MQELQETGSDYKNLPENVKAMLPTWMRHYADQSQDNQKQKVSELETIKQLDMNIIINISLLTILQLFQSYALTILYRDVPHPHIQYKTTILPINYYISRCVSPILTQNIRKTPPWTPTNSIWLTPKGRRESSKTRAPTSSPSSWTTGSRYSTRARTSPTWTQCPRTPPTLCPTR